MFNVAQVESLPARFYPEPEAPSPAPSTAERIETADRYFEATGARVAHGGNQTFYRIGEDRIQLPPFEAFHDAHGYYAISGHETVHWTRHPSRLDRSFGRERWGDEGYAREELVAELGAAFLAADLGLALEPRADHAYIGHCIVVLRNDKRAIVSAASHAEREAAQRAVGLRQPTPPITETKHSAVRRAASLPSCTLAATARVDRCASS